MSKVQIDDLDRQIIDILGNDARISNRKIAADLNVTEGTVRGRIKRLQQERLMTFTAITDFGLENTSKLAFIGVQACVEDVRSIATKIADVPLVNAVTITLGRFNIWVVCLFDTLDSLFEVASERILAIPGVHHVETSIAVKTIKYNARVARITAADLSLTPEEADNSA
ncbi:MAG: Lrp/AsnC family transcriptional regulator [Alphaproteobacteria bacterium]|nr:Lrp/AsnC family transcriptional regulator [Alphaproteobacteria bacterium]